MITMGNCRGRGFVVYPFSFVWVGGILDTKVPGVPLTVPSVSTETVEGGGEMHKRENENMRWKEVWGKTEELGYFIIAGRVPVNVKLVTGKFEVPSTSHCL